MTPAERSGMGRLLEVRPVWGQRSRQGSQTIARYAADLIDIEVLETIREIDPPLRLVADFRVLRFLPYDPAERLPETIAPDLTPDPDQLFHRQIGRKPWAIRMTAALSPMQGETEVTLTESLRSARPLGWGGKRRWTHRLMQEANDIFQRLAG